MAFRNGCYATVWEVQPKSPTVTTCRISTSKKDKNTGEYETDFSGFVGFCGSAAASKAMSLHERDRIKLNEVSVTNKYDKENNKTYTNFNCYEFELADNPNNNNTAASVADEPFMQVEGDEEEGLPF